MKQHNLNSQTEPLNTKFEFEVVQYRKVCASQISCSFAKLQTLYNVLFAFKLFSVSNALLTSKVVTVVGAKSTTR